MTYGQYENSPQGLQFLTGDIMPWDDYIIFRSDENTSVAIYGQCDDNLNFDTATVRTVWRESGYGSYLTNETTDYDVSVIISNPYYAYGNVIGNHYNLPASNNITAVICCGAFVLCCLISVFRLVWSLRKGVAK